MPGRSSNGFSLLELIIVIIIVGVLASLALPRYFVMIETSRVTEALTHIKALREALYRYKYSNNGYYFGAHLDQDENTLAIDNPNDDPQRHFTYVVNVGLNDWFQIMAIRNTYENSDPNMTVHSWIWYEELNGQPEWKTFGFYKRLHLPGDN